MNHDLTISLMLMRVFYGGFVVFFIFHCHEIGLIFFVVFNPKDRLFFFQKEKIKEDSRERVIILKLCLYKES